MDGGSGGSDQGWGGIIPPEWVGLEPRSEPAVTAPGPCDPEKHPTGQEAPPATGSAAAPVRSVIASIDPAVLELVTAVTARLERGGCFTEPGKPCHGSGRCRQRGY